MRLRTGLSLGLIALVAVVSSISSATPLRSKPTPKADAITGEWDVVLTSPDNTLELTLKLKLAGNKVTGTSESSHLGPGMVSDGSWANNKLKFTLTTNHATLALTGTLQKGKLAGEWDTGHMQGKWEAKKK